MCIVEDILILSAADSSIDLQILDRLHEKTDPLQILGRNTEPPHDLFGAGVAFFTRFENDIQSASVHGRIHRSRADKRRDTLNIGIFFNDIGNLSLLLQHRLKRDVLSSIGYPNYFSGILLW